MLSKDEGYTQLLGTLQFFNIYQKIYINNDDIKYIINLYLPFAYRFYKIITQYPTNCMLHNIFFMASISRYKKKVVRTEIIDFGTINKTC